MLEGLRSIFCDAELHVDEYAVGQSCGCVLVLQQSVQHEATSMVYCHLHVIPILQRQPVMITETWVRECSR